MSRSISHSLVVLIALLGACSFAWEPAFDVTVEPSEFDSVAISDPENALTFARVGPEGAWRVIAVTRYQAGSVEGVDLTASAPAYRSDASEVESLLPKAGKSA